MKDAVSKFLLALGLVGASLASPAHRDEVIRFHGPFEVTADSLHNIHVEFTEDSFEGEVKLVYGDCEMTHAHKAHHHIGSVFVRRDERPERFVWTTPSDAPHAHCLHAFSGTTRVGRSSPITITSSPVYKRQSIADVADALGPWFDGVAYMKSKNNSAAFVSRAKNSSVAIVGGGMSGLMTSLLLSSVGMHNWHIIESSQRVGGRVRTHYFNNTRPDEYQYQEMGPMRFPVSVTYAGTNETIEIKDHRMVFQLGDVLNKINAGNPELAVNFIPWTQNGLNLPADSGGVRLPDGRIPTVADIKADSALSYTPPPQNATAVADAEAAAENYTKINDINTMRNLAANVYKAHKEAVENGLFDWSEAGYLRYALGYSANTTDYVAGTADYPIWEDYYENTYFAATAWRTIDKGLDSLPRAFYPHVANKTTFGRQVEGLSYDESTGKIAVNWREDPMQLIPESEEYDYAVVAVPFSKVRLWNLPHYSSLLSRAISTMNYEPACKMALHYRSRFWEHTENPIFGGCGSVDVAGVGNVCYPSYQINSTGPGVVLASYASGTPARSAAALSTEDHVALIQRTMVEIHGEVAAKEYTGK